MQQEFKGKVRKRVRLACTCFLFYFHAFAVVAVEQVGGAIVVREWT